MLSKKIEIAGFEIHRDHHNVDVVDLLDRWIAYLLDLPERFDLRPKLSPQRVFAEAIQHLLREHRSKLAIFFAHQQIESLFGCGNRIGRRGRKARQQRECKQRSLEAHTGKLYNSLRASYGAALLWE